MADPVLVARLEANIDKFEKQLSRAYSLANKRTRDIENRFDKTASNVGGGLGKMGGLLAAAFSVTAIAAFAKHAIEVADNIGEAADRIGIATDKLQELQYIARLTGASTEELDKAMLQLTKRVGKSGGEVDELERAFAKMGLRLTDIKGKKPEEIFELIADGIKATKDPFEQAALAVAFFGDRLGQKLLPALKGGSAAIKTLAAEARKMGLIIPEETIRKAAQADDEFKRLGTAFNVAGANLSAGLLPGLTRLREVMTDPAFQKGIESIGEGIGKIIKFVADNPGALAALGGFMVGSRVGGVAGGVIGAATAFTAAQIAARNETVRLEEAIKDLEAQADKLFESQKGKSVVDKETTMVHITAVNAEIEKLRAKLFALKPAATKVEVTKTPEPIVGPQQFFSPDLERQLEQVALKTRIARGEFSEWADGLPETISKLEATKDIFKSLGNDLSKYPAQVQAVNAAMKGLDWANDLKAASKEFSASFGRALEDAIIDGKELSEVMKQLAKDIAKMALRLAIIKPLEKGLEGAFSGLVPRMSGGPVSAGTPYMVGEHGREMFIPSTSGTVLPNSATKGAGAQQNIIINDYSGHAKVRTKQTDNGSGVEVFIPALEQMLASGVSRGRGALSKSVDARRRGTNLYG